MRLVLLLSLLLSASAAVAEQPRPAEGDRSETADLRYARLDAPTPDAALNPDTGEVLTLDPFGSSVTLLRPAFFTGDGKAKITRKLDGRPVAVAFKPHPKRPLFLVVLYDTSRLLALDVKTLDPVGHVQFNRPHATGVAVSANPDDPYAWCAARGYGQQIQPVDLRSMTLLAPIDLQQETSDPVVSADGRFLYARTRSSSPTGFNSYEITRDTSGPRLRMIVNHHDSTTGYVPDPYGLTTAVSEGIYTPSLETQIVALEHRPLTFYPGRALLIADATRNVRPRDGKLDNVQLLGVDGNTYRPLQTVQLSPEQMVPDTRGSVRPDTAAWLNQGLWFDLMALPDPARERVVVIWGERIATVPVKALGKAGPVLAVRHEAAPAAVVDQPFRLPLRPVTQGTTIELTRAPEGMRLEGGVLTWTPDAESLEAGAHGVTLTLEAEGASREQSLHISVALPHVELPFEVAGVELSPDARHALAVAHPYTAARTDRNMLEATVTLPSTLDYTRRPRARDAEPDPGRFALIDVRGVKVQATARVDSPVRLAALAGDRVLLVRQESDLLHPFRLDTLQSLDPMILPGSPSRLTTLGEDRLLISLRGQQGEVEQLYRLPELQPLGDPRALERHHAGSQTSRTLPTGVGTLRDGLLLDASLQQVRLIRDAERVPSLAPVPHSRSQSPPPLVRWNRTLSGSRVSTGSTMLFDTADPLNLLLEQAPAVASLDTTRSVLRGLGVDETTLTFRDLITGEVLHQQKLGVQEAASQSNTAPPPQTLNDAGDRVVVSVGSRVYLVPLPEAVREAPMPLHLMPEQSALVVSTDAKPVELKHTHRGGEGKVSYTLDDAAMGRGRAAAGDEAGSASALTIDSVTSTLTLDPGDLRERVEGLATAAMQRAQLVPQHFMHAVPDAAVSRGPSLQRFLEQAQAPLPHPLRERVRGYPLALPIHVAARDERGDVAELAYHVLLDVPPARLEEMLEGQRREMQRQREQALARQQEQEAQMQARRERHAAQADTPGDADARLRALEARVQRLEEKIDTLIRVLEASPRTAPERREQPEKRVAPPSVE